MKKEELLREIDEKIGSYVREYVDDPEAQDVAAAELSEDIKEMVEEEIDRRQS